MEKNKEVVSVSLIIVLMFFVSFLLLFNDLINYFIVFMTITVLLFGYFCYIVFSKKDEFSKYNRKLKQILKTYDSILIYSDRTYDVNNQNIIFVKKFEDLLIAQEEFNNPLIYIEEEQSSVFLLSDDKELLVYVMKANDDVVSFFENKLINLINKLKTPSKSQNNEILEDLEKTTIIQLKNDKVYKVSPLKK